ncbi:MAG TPA: glycosyltransferase family 2 protein [Candidatus Hydrogenedentes bacterium]|nr:glycosyltransferase family 2 protein [Candidatus Hydrogenedentota bacterium]
MSISLPLVSVVFPCLNEEGTIGRCVDAARTALDAAGIEAEIVVADNGSTDASRRVAEEAGARVVDADAPGYGSALRAGLRAAEGRYLVFLDADMSYDCGDIPRFVEALRDGADLVMGSRFRGGIDPGAMPRSHRYFGTPAMTLLANLLFGSRITDINCGMRAITREAFDRLDLRSQGMEFASEMVIKAARAKLDIREIPIVFHADQRGRRPHLRSFRDGWRHLQLMLHFCSMWLFLVPGMLLLGGNFAAIVAVSFDCVVSFVTYLVALSGTIVGTQLLLLGLSAQGRVPYSKYAPLAGRPLVRMFRSWIRIEKALVLGAVATAIGAAMLGYGILHVYWRPSTFWPSSSMPGIVEFNPEPIRLALIGVAIFANGLQVFFTSLIMGLFGLRLAEDEPAMNRNDHG